ncbi:UNVERIFIED_CONTAM: hypothetical protein Slati_2925700 [Sesamum latifolium]|uniref:Uncharacterized protein n=1 Tax=Sesamum latifolium TaxID=2727402 RepID=A0AAW2VCP5_9LAMI
MGHESGAVDLDDDAELAESDYDISTELGDDDDRLFEDSVDDRISDDSGDGLSLSRDESDADVVGSDGILMKTK